jgi:SNF2 family DNA or RNA helicase
MNRNTATKLLRDKLDEYGLKDWSIRLIPNADGALGLCSHTDKCIILNAHHVDTHPEPEIQDTILHEIAHALVGPGHDHDATWTTKARELGCNNLTKCATISLDPRVIDALRSGATIQVEFEEHTIERNIKIEEKVYRPKYQVTRLQDKCPECGKVAVEKFAINTVDKDGNEVKLITLECFHIIKKVIPRATPYETMVSNDWKPEIKACKHDFPSKEEAREKHIPSNCCKKCGEFKLYNFQTVGARAAEVALAVQKGYGIFDDMGLGKTIQALALLRFHAKTYTPTMVVTKSAIKFQWFKAAVTWLGPEFIGQIISTSRDYLMPGLKLYIIPYDLLRRFPREKLHALGIKLVILDEVQQIKNPDSSRTQEVRKLVSANSDCKVIELSGTPWKNRGSEFFPALNLIDPVKFHSYQHYLDTWVEFYYEGAKKKMGGIRNVKKFKEYTASLIMRREYNEVMDEFPEINRMKLPVQLDDLQQSTYDDSVSEFVEWYNEYVIGGEEDSISGIEILAKMARMRHITGLAKIPATLGFLEQFIEDTDRKIVVFVHHKDVGQLLISALTNCSKESNPDWYEFAQELRNQGIKVFSYTSEHTGKPAGYQIQEDFNATKRCIMIASTLACGEGLNLQTCADTMMHERQWNPQNEDQAAPGRFRRIGQVSGVINITFPEGEGTIDEHLDYIVETKRRNFHAAMNKGEAQTWNEGAIGKELAEIIVRKHKEKFKGVKTAAKSVTAAARL